MSSFWHAKHTDWWQREEIVELGEEFGAAGPAVVDWLECRAKSLNRGGLVKSGPKSIARGTFVDVVTVGHVLSRCVTLGLLVDYEEDGPTFKARISWWRADQDKFHAATRQARRRAGNTEDSDSMSRSVTDRHAESQNVTYTRQDKTKDLTTSSEVLPVEVEAELEPRPSSTRSFVARELFVYWQEKCRHPGAKLSADRRSKIEARLREGYTVEDIRQAIDGAAVSAFVNEKGERFDDIELICRNGSKLENFKARAGASSAGTDDWDAKYGPVAT